MKNLQSWTLNISDDDAIYMVIKSTDYEKEPYEDLEIRDTKGSHRN